MVSAEISCRLRVENCLGLGKVVPAAWARLDIDLLPHSTPTPSRCHGDANRACFRPTQWPRLLVRLRRQQSAAKPADMVGVEPGKRSRCRRPKKRPTPCKPVTPAGRVTPKSFPSATRHSTRKSLSNAVSIKEELTSTTPCSFGSESLKTLRLCGE